MFFVYYLCVDKTMLVENRVFTAYRQQRSNKHTALTELAQDFYKNYAIVVSVSCNAIFLSHYDWEEENRIHVCKRGQVNHSRPTTVPARRDCLTLHVIHI